MNEIKYIYIGNRSHAKHKGVISIGYRFIGNTLQYAVAFCNKNDNFSKEISHKIIKGRFDKNIYDELNIFSHEKKYNHVYKFIKLQLNQRDKYFAKCKVPSWVSKLK